MATASASIAKAESASALESAPVELLAARDKLARAEAASREKRFAEARRLAEQADADAELAESKARAVKAQAAALELARTTSSVWPIGAKCTSACYHLAPHSETPSRRAGSLANENRSKVPFDHATIAWSVPLINITPNGRSLRCCNGQD